LPQIRIPRWEAGVHHLEAHLLGVGRVNAPSRTGAAPLSRSCLLLLAYLLLHRDRTHARDVVASAFWGESPEPLARRRLNTTVWRLRRALEPDAHASGEFIIGGRGGNLGFNAASAFWLDVDEFETLATPHVGRAAGELERDDLVVLERAVWLYKGELLEGEYDEWVLSYRARLANLHLASLLRLIEGHRRLGELGKAITFAELVLEREPLREDVHRQLMGLYALDGRRAEALRHFDRCRAALRRELQIEPMPETVHLAARIVGGDEIPASDSRLDLLDVVSELEQRCQEMERLSRSINESLARLRTRAHL
jgi:DNA-binding SARP family transcriptional activator